MIITYKDGVVTGINRTPNADESILKVTRKDLRHGLKPDCYRVVNNNLVPLDRAEMAEKDNAMALAAARETKTSSITALRARAERLSIVKTKDGVFPANMELLQVIDLERRLAVAAGEATVRIHDVSRNPHDLNMDDTDALILAMRRVVMDRYRHEQYLLRLVNLAESVKDVDDITVDYK